VHSSFNIFTLGISWTVVPLPLLLNYTTGGVSCFDKPHQKLPILVDKAAFMSVIIFPAFTSTAIPNFSIFSFDVSNLRSLYRMSTRGTRQGHRTLRVSCKKHSRKLCNDIQRQQRHVKIFGTQNCGRTRLASWGVGVGGHRFALSGEFQVEIRFHFIKAPT